MQSSVSRLGGCAFAGAQQDVHTDDGFDAVLQAFAIELHHREQIVLVGDRDRRHAERGDAFHQLRDAHHAVLQREFGVQAEVDESSGRHGARVYTRTRALIVLAKGFNEMETEAAAVSSPGTRKASS